MIPWINAGVLVAVTILFTYFYLASVRTWILERKIGDKAYKRATVNRIVSAVLMSMAGACYVVYFFYPLPVPALNRFPWPYWLSVILGGLVAIPSLYLWFRGMIDAGKGSLVVTKKFKPYGGIYKRIRHPQAAGELLVWWVIAFFLNSLFLALYSLIWIPIFIWVSLAEEKDLIARYGDAYREYRKTAGFFTLK
jgi:methanethiol S-methyltransferase